MTRRKDATPETPKTEIQQPDFTVSQPFVAEVDVPIAPALEPEVPVDKSPPPPPVRASRQPGILAPLIGGALAAIGGFALSHFNVLGLSSSSSDVATLAARLDEATNQEAGAQQTLGTEIAAVAKRVATLEAAPAPDPSRMDALEQRLAAIEAVPTDGTASTAALTAKIADLERRLTALPAGGNAPELQKKLDDALARLTAAESDATARATEAEAAATKAARETALVRLSNAIASGQPFTADLQALADPTLAEALGAMADTGVPTLASLQEAFPEAARQALLTARDLGSESGWTDRLFAFLAAQTEARPLTPQTGDAPDAILSRAEFALSEGRVTDALAEVDTLDPAVKAPLDAWVALATAHLAAASALNAARGE